MFRSLWPLAASLLIACQQGAALKDDAAAGADAGAQDIGAGAQDAGPQDASAQGIDAGAAEIDAGAADAGEGRDAREGRDAGGGPPDAGSSADASLSDSGAPRVCLGSESRDDLTPTTAAPACNVNGLRRDLDVAYVSDGLGVDGPHRLDLYRPQGPGPFRLVIWIHGGGWMSGDENNVNQAIGLACSGFAVASIDYRLSDEAIFPAQIQDVKSAVRFLRANAASYQLDPGRFAAFGSSAGGHLAALLGTSGGVPAFEDAALGNAGVSSAVQAVVDWYGPTDFARMDSQLSAQGCPGQGHHSAADSAESLVLGCQVGTAACAAANAAASPMTYVDANDPPFLVIHGTADCTVPRAQSADLAGSLRAASVCVSERSLVGAGHGGPDWLTLPPQDTVETFLDLVLR